MLQKRSHYKLLIIIQVAALLGTMGSITSCSVERRCQRHISKAKELGCLTVKTDTVWKEVNIPGKTITIEVPAEVDSAGLSQLLDSVIQATKDSCLKKKDLMNVVKQIPCKIKPAAYEDSLVKVTAVVENGVQKLSIEHKPRKLLVPQIQKTQEIIKTVEKNKWWVWPALISCFVVIFLLALRGRK